jgi:choice-of-anchor B domain-containing protein
MNKIILSLTLVLAFCFANAQTTYPSSNINLIGFINPETVTTSGNIKYSGCWGYNQTSKNKEYAVVGSSNGTYFIDITAPASPTVCDYVQGTSSPGVWREVNIYQNYAYVVSDNSPPNSFQIIDMQYLPDSVHVVHNSNTTHFERGHAVYVDVNKAKLYVSGIRFQGSGSANMRVYSLATPSAPVLLRTLAQDYPSITYVHDMFVRNDTVYAHCGNQGLHVYKLTASNTFTALGSLTGYADAGYCHSSSLTKDGKTLIMCDEVPTGLRIKSLDVSNLNNITVNALFRPNTNTQFVGHNPYVVGDKYAFVSCYQDGLYLYDISSPATPTIAGYFDTHPQGGASASNNYGSSSYNGNWGAFPYTKSGLIVACDMQNGVFILGATAFAPAANFNNAANICSGVATTFTDVSTNTPTSWSWNIPGASVTTSTLQNPSVTFTAGGVYNATLIATNASGTNSAVKSITVTATPTVITSGVASICIGSSATLTASGASTYTWNPGALTGTNIVVSPTTTVTYNVIGLSGSCSNTNTKILTVNALPVVNASSSSSLMCVGQTVTLSATGAASYTWMPGNITGNTIALSPTVSTTYSVIGTSTTNCINTSSAISVSVSACTGINSLIVSDNQFSISPNPSFGIFEVKGTSEAFDVSIYNSIGQLVKFSAQNKNSANIDLSNAAKGIYYLVISSQGKRINKKVVIE